MAFDRTFEVKSPLLTLRAKSHDDLQNDYEWRADPELIALDAAKPLTLSFAEFALLHRDDVDNFRSGNIKLAIDAPNGEHIGNCVFYNVDYVRRRCEYGIMIGKSKYWNKGLGCEATRLAVQSVFERTRIRRMYLHTLADNRRAISCFAKCGFEKTLLMERDGREFVYMELTPDGLAAANRALAANCSAPAA